MSRDFITMIPLVMSFDVITVIPQDAFILDTGAGDIFAWVGKNATQQEKKAAFKNAIVSGKKKM